MLCSRGTKAEILTVTRSGGTAAFDVSFATLNESATIVDGDYAGRLVRCILELTKTQTISVARSAAPTMRHTPALARSGDPADLFFFSPKSAREPEHS